MICPINYFIGQFYLFALFELLKIPMSKVSISQNSILIEKSSILTGQYFDNEIAGIDEAGRGCLAGPVVAAAVILPKDAKIDGLDDSKVLPSQYRSAISAEIGMIALAWGLGVVWPAEIDRINILQATFKAMSHAVATLKITPRLLLVDGDKRIPPQWLMKETHRDYTQQNIIDGDAKIPVISAASIIAKVFRDDLMERLDSHYPGYGFAKHKGYGTEEHIKAIQSKGPSRMHRLTFAKVKTNHLSSSQPEIDGEQSSLFL